MNNRIKQFMEYKGLSPSELADTIGVQRSNVTHVLHGRNNPSFPFISKLIETYPEINAKWLIIGEGEMLVVGAKPTSTLFTAVPDEKKEIPAAPGVQEADIVSPKEEPIMKTPEIETPFFPNVPNSCEKEVERIVVFFSDQTFKQYTPSK